MLGHLIQGILTEGEGSEQFTSSLRYLVFVKKYIMNALSEGADLN
jgi:hypothetical protein